MPSTEALGDGKTIEKLVPRPSTTYCAETTTTSSKAK